MTLSQVYQIATDGEFRLLAGFANPPRAGVVTGTLPSGQVTVELDDAEGGVVTAWPLNGYTYATNTVVYVVFASDSAGSGIVVGAKSAGYSAPGGLELPLVLEGAIDTELAVAVRASRTGDVVVEATHSGSSATGNGVVRRVMAQSSTERRELLEERVNWSTATDASRATVVSWFTAIAGTFAEALRMTGKRLGLFNAAAGPVGMFHAHDGTGGVAAVNYGGINSSAPRILIPDAAGDVVRRIAYTFVLTDNTTSVASVNNLGPGQTADVTVGSTVIRFTCAAAGTFYAHRQSGSGTVTIMGWCVWM